MMRFCGNFSFQKKAAGFPDPGLRRRSLADLLPGAASQRRAGAAWLFYNMP